MVAAIQETILKLHWFGFHTVVVVVDGASANLSIIKLWTEGIKGAYGVIDNNDKHSVKPWFVDAFNDQNVYFVVCPSHQVSFITFVHVHLCRLVVVHM